MPMPRIIKAVRRLLCSLVIASFTVGLHASVPSVNSSATLNHSAKPQFESRTQSRSALAITATPADFSFYEEFYPVNIGPSGTAQNRRVALGGQHDQKRPREDSSAFATKVFLNSYLVLHCFASKVVKVITRLCISCHFDPVPLACRFASRLHSSFFQQLR